jgi:hypothetical protein
MTRKDYIVIAAALNSAAPHSIMDEDRHQHLMDCTAIANVLGHDNPRFDHARFLKACGVE